jgi:hypothetical protein
MKLFSEGDVETAFRDLQPHIQGLVDRFGPAQAHHMLMVMADTVAPGGRDKPPPIYISVGGKVVRSRML